jgi:pimeloyl-ACP methyl ester carboxylesterase
MSDHYVETNGIRLHYVDHPGVDHPGAGPVLVLAPGLTANAHSFGGLVRAGLADVARVLALDLRGRGESDAPSSGYAMEDHARDVLGLLDALGLERVVMGGHSFGGLLTYWLAANHPERVERCVVIDAPAAVDPAVVGQVQPALARLGNVYPSWDAYVSLARSMPYFDEGGWDDDVEAYFRADVHVRPDGSVQARSRPEHIEEAIRGTLAVDWPTVAARIEQPTLLLRAPGSFGPPGSPALLTREDAERTAAAMADCRVVDGIGNHVTFVFGDGARVLTAAIADFLAGAAVTQGEPEHRDGGHRTMEQA